MRRSTPECNRPGRPGELARRLVDHHGPEPIIAALEAFVSEARRNRIQHVLDTRVDSLTVVMDAPHDPHNGAAVMRSCDALGIARVHIIERREEFLISKTVAKGTERWVEVCRHPPSVEIAEELSDFELIATHPKGELLPDALKAIPRVALVLGNERDGIEPRLLAACKRSVRIPMTGFVESLNVSVSAAILLREAMVGRAGDLPAREKRRLYARAMILSASQANAILDAAGLAELGPNAD